MSEENPFFTFEKPAEEQKTPPKATPIQKPKKEKPSPPPPSGKVTEKIIVSRSVDKDGNVSIAWADKDTIHPLALHYYDKYKEFY